MNRKSGHDRIRLLKRLMMRKKIKALLVTKREDVRYLTGFTGSAGSVLVASGRPWLITDFRYELQAARQTSGVRIVIQKKDFISALKEATAISGEDRLWFDESSVSVETANKLKKTGLSVTAHADMVGELRYRKDSQELKHIREAIRRAEEAFRELRPSIRPGARERDLAFKLEFLMREKGARKAAFDSIIASGRNGAMPHASVSSRQIKDGDMVTFDFGAEADGYFSDMTRTYCIGKPSARQREIHALVQSAQSAAINSVRPGIACTELDAAARDTIKQAGHGEHFGHGTGHGIGLMVHEGPSLSPLSKDHAAESMVFTVEPGVYIPGWGGVRIEDMVLVTKRGARILTSLPRELEGLKYL